MHRRRGAYQYRYASVAFTIAMRVASGRCERHFRLSADAFTRIPAPGGGSAATLVDPTAADPTTAATTIPKRASRAIWTSPRTVGPTPTPPTGTSTRAKGNSSPATGESGTRLHRSTVACHSAASAKPHEGAHLERLKLQPSDGFNRPWLSVCRYPLVAVFRNSFRHNGSAAVRPGPDLYADVCAVKVNGSSNRVPAFCSGGSPGPNLEVGQ
ncbi:hypothetical protein NONO_c02020 [Nocardia nova SH22a]|uniref:Uncharacterized protein n=1 Tax=Nocardia nova SH22a TaxID=1415166 RepID=W5T7A5_9NOCA|nr:hypothetical protein NONO_c02020 [Nocardia nova SH22a]